MSNLNSFADLIRKGKEDKRIKDLQEQERKINVNAPLLANLFKTVSTAKIIEEKKQAVIAKVDALEANQVTQEDIDDLVTEKLEQVESIAEKKLMAVVKKLQDDIANLKRHVDSKPSHTVVNNSAGSGEVRILRMDDIDLSNMGDGKVLAYDATLNKIVFQDSNNSVSDENMPYAKRIDFISDNLIYKAEAAVGSNESSQVWRIHKIVIGTDNDYTETWADGVAEFNKIWADRLTYTYS